MKTQFYSNIHSNKAFSMVEILVALVLMAVGLLGLAGMTQLVMRGTDQANQLNDATDICRSKIESLRDITYADLGAEDDVMTIEAWEQGATQGQIVQEPMLNAQGITDCGFYFREADVLGSPCDGIDIGGACSGPANPLVKDNFPDTPQGEACWEHVRDAGPYIYTLSFVVCDGEDYDSAGNPPAGAASFTGPIAGTYSGEVNCRASQATRPEALACQTEDILNPGPNSTEKMMKVLCTWRKRDGRCGFVNFSALRVEN